MADIYQLYGEYLELSKIGHIYGVYLKLSKKGKIYDPYPKFLHLYLHIFGAPHPLAMQYNIRSNFILLH